MPVKLRICQAGEFTCLTHVDEKSMLCGVVPSRIYAKRGFTELGYMIDMSSMVTAQLMTFVYMWLRLRNNKICRELFVYRPQ